MGDAPQTRIVVQAPVGRFGDVQTAASAENEVDWQAAEGPEQEACVLSFAATDIARHLAACSNVEAAHRISDSEPTAAESLTVRLETKRACAAAGRPLPAGLPLAPQSYAIETVEATELDDRRRPAEYRIVGVDAVGALYGAYELLTRLGFAWFSPDPSDRAVPDRLNLPFLDLRESPSFVLRGFWATDGRATEEFLLWMARNKLNLWSAEQPNKPFCRKLGVRFTTGGHAIFGRYADPSVYFADHPEWYGMRGGLRSDDIRGVVGDNICFANAEVRGHIASRLADDLADGEWRWVDLINVWALDNGRYCECDECARLGNPTDQILLLAHDCRKAILDGKAAGRINREVIVSVPAYHESLDPPTRPLPEDFDHGGVVVTFFPIERCYVHAFADPRCVEMNQDLLRYWSRWVANPENPFRGSMLIGEYYNVSSYAGIAAAFTETMAADIRYYHESGARMLHYMHVPVANWGTLAATNCQFATLLWNHERAVEQWFRSFLTGRYRELADEMGAVYRDLERALANAKPLKHYAGMDRHTLRKTLAQPGAPPSGATAVSSSPQPTASPREAADRLFTTNHLRYDERRVGSGMPLAEMVTSLDRVVRRLEALQLSVADPVVRGRLTADLRRVRYTRLTVAFYYHLARLRMFEAAANDSPDATAQAGSVDPASAAAEAAALRDVGEALRAETQMPKTTPGEQGLDWYRFYQTGLTATWLAETYDAVMDRYGLSGDMTSSDEGAEDGRAM